MGLGVLYPSGPYGDDGMYIPYHTERSKAERQTGQSVL